MLLGEGAERSREEGTPVQAAGGVDVDEQDIIGARELLLRFMLSSPTSFKQYHTDAPASGARVQYEGGRYRMTTRRLGRKVGV